MVLKVVVCTRDANVASQISNALGDEYKVVHQETPRGVFAGSKPVCVVGDMDIPNVVPLFGVAEDEKIPRISIVSSYEAQQARLRAGDFDSFQRDFLDSNVLAAKVMAAWESIKPKPKEEKQELQPV